MFLLCGVAKTAKPEPARWWSRHATPVLLGAMGLCVVVWAVGLVLLSRLDDTPGWWPGVDPGSPEVIAEAEKLERAFANQVALVREPTDGDGSDWRVRISQKSANAWLAVRLRSWVENEGGTWPADVESVRVGFVGRRVTLGARVTGVSGSSVLWVTLTPEVRQDGSVWLRAHGARVGGVPVPGSWVLSGLEREVEKHAPGATETVSLRAVLAGAAPLMVEPVVRLPDGRRVRIVELAAGDDGVAMAMRTETPR